MIAGNAVATATIVNPQSVDTIINTFRPDEPPPDTPPSRTSTINALSDVERDLSLPGAKFVQAALCIENTDGDFGLVGSGDSKGNRPVADNDWG